jgi:hypothetical protein
MIGREYRAVAELPDRARTPVAVAVFHDPVRRMWGAYVVLDGIDPASGRGATGPVAWGLTGDAATRRAVADYYMASIQINLPWGGAR